VESESHMRSSEVLANSRPEDFSGCTVSVSKFHTRSKRTSLHICVSFNKNHSTVVFDIERGQQRSVCRVSGREWQSSLLSFLLNFFLGATTEPFIALC
jgi:hypothetical protein